MTTDTDKSLAERLRAAKAQLDQNGVIGSEYLAALIGECLSALTAPVEMETTAESRLGVFAECSLADAILRDFDRLAALLAAEKADRLSEKNAIFADLDEAEARAEKAEAALREADEWLQYTLNMVEGDGRPPNWDGIRAFRKQIAALEEKKPSSPAQAAETGDELVAMQQHRDHWRGYAYGKRDKPADFLDGNMVDREPTLIETQAARIRELEGELDELRQGAATNYHGWTNAESALADIRGRVEKAVKVLRLPDYQPDPDGGWQMSEAVAILTDPSPTPKGGDSDTDVEAHTGNDIAQPARDTDTPAPAAGRCFECGTKLVGPICPRCNPSAPAPSRCPVCGALYEVAQVYGSRLTYECPHGHIWTPQGDTPAPAPDMSGVVEVLSEAKVALNIAANDAADRQSEELRARCAKACNSVAHALSTLRSADKGGKSDG